MSGELNKPVHIIPYFPVVCMKNMCTVFMHVDAVYFFAVDIANYKGKLYNLPFNMNTFYQLWGVRTPAEARAKIQEQCREYEHITHPQNLEEQALKLCVKDIYRQLINRNGMRRMINAGSSVAGHSHGRI